MNDLGVIHQHRNQSDMAVEYFLGAIEKDPYYLDAKLNLAGCYLDKKQWENVVLLLEPIFQGDPENAVVINQLSLAYLETGRPVDAQRIQSGSVKGIVTNKFIDAIWSSILFWESVENLNLRERLEGVASGVLAAIDGTGSPNVHFRLAGENPEDGSPIELEWLGDMFYYKQTESARLIQLRERRPDLGLVLKSDSPDWKAFARKIYREIKSEGGCLGDYTHTKKILRWDPLYKKFDIDACLEYYQQNIGPCDCHVMRGIEV